MSEAKYVHLKVKCSCCKEILMVSFAGNVIIALGVEVEKFNEGKWEGK